MRTVYECPICIPERYYDASREAQSELEHKKMQLAEIEAEEGKGRHIIMNVFFTIERVIKQLHNS